MKSLEELYKEVQENEELKKEFVTSFKEGDESCCCTGKKFFYKAEPSVRKCGRLG